MVFKKYDDSFEFCYNQKENKEIRLMLLKKIEKKNYNKKKGNKIIKE